ncbi:alpha/beta fold hydrolase [Streptomyces carpinensis]|uniref:Alpha/beta hydrolase n=1 Tax=Streptomyces carpinensis TaxID=66369 RepID=A0ABV1WAN2_9ACTN|nr:alpha/beta hydrolase [Streptomyces carpinensis]
MLDHATHSPPERPAPAQAGEARYLPDPLRHEAADTPEWFRRTTLDEPTVGEVKHEGARIRYLRWPGGPGPATLLVHGGSAHAHWWSPLAPLLRSRGPVVAMDLSGHGLSDWRPDGYTVTQWAGEVRAVAGATSTAPPVVIAHSMGGIVSAHLAVTAGDTIGRLVVVDSPVWDSAPAPEGEIAARADAPTRFHADPEVPIARFRLIPRQECSNSWYLRHIAWHGLTATTHGYRWRFDPRIFAGNGGGTGAGNRIARFEGSLSDSACPYAVVMGENSYLTPQAVEVFGAASRSPAAVSRHGRTPLALVPSAGHHVLLDQPLALVAAVRGVLAAWR